MQRNSEKNELQYYIVNVFSEQGLYGGNPLGVVIDTIGLSTEQMQAITRQFNYSESTFIQTEDERGGNVRIFLPTREIPFAGHPTLGTAYILEQRWRRKTATARDQVQLQLKQGQIQVQFRTLKQDMQLDRQLVEMEQFPVKILGEFKEKEEITKALGISLQDLEDAPLYLIAPSDLPFLFIPVKNARILQQVQPQLSEIKRVLEKVHAEPYLFAREGIDGGQVHARFFAPHSGVPEDPATGSAQAALITYLLKSGLHEGLVKEEGQSQVIVEQGYEMGRPSKLYNRVLATPREIKVFTGGHVAFIAKGKLIQ